MQTNCFMSSGYYFHGFWVGSVLRIPLDTAGGCSCQQLPGQTGAWAPQHGQEQALRNRGLLFSNRWFFPNLLSLSCISNIEAWFREFCSESIFFAVAATFVAWPFPLHLAFVVILPCSIKPVGGIAQETDLELWLMAWPLNLSSCLYVAPYSLTLLPFLKKFWGDILHRGHGMGRMPYFQVLLTVLAVQTPNRSRPTLLISERPQEANRDCGLQW